jgi:DNA polymerase IV
LRLESIARSLPTFNFCSAALVVDAMTRPDCGFCRDCLTDLKRPVRRCTSCGSPRIVRHAELNELSLAHIDCDAFYAAVEKRDNPDLADKPVIIGGGKRGVVSTACYIARIHGVRSAMPMFKALDACPDAIVIKPNMDKYAAVGREVRQLMMDLTPMVQPISIDEAFLDLAGTEALHRDTACRTLAKFARRIESEIGISVSVGLSYCKFLAKVASDLDKPRGFSVIGRADALAFLAPRPVTTIWGVGKAFAETLAHDGIHTIGQLQTMEETELMRRYGSMGQRLYRLARGMDERRVEPREDAKSVSAETTFDTDHHRIEDLVPVLRALSETVAHRLKKAGIAGNTVVLKLKSNDFRIRTRNRRLDDPTRYADRIFRTGLAMLQKECDGTRYRLLGIGVSGLTDAERADPPDLVDPMAGKRAVAETAMDSVRAKFGLRSVETGYTFGRGNRGRPQRDK